MARKKGRSNVLNELVLGLNGRDVLACLEHLAQIQQKALSGKALSGASKGEFSTLMKIEQELGLYPRRYRIIYKGFANGWDLDKLNSTLVERHEKKLYARDLIEATLIYSFRKQLSFEDWKKLVDGLKELEGKGAYNDLLISGMGGSYTAFPLERIEKYVNVFSLSANDKLFTMQRTRTVEENIDKLSGDLEFVGYICENIRSFCEGREKARYYICKYFLLYVDTMIKDYMAARSRTEKRNIYQELPLSNISKMDPNRHANMTKEEVLECLKTAKVSSNKLFEVVNRFYSYILLADSEAEDPNWEEYSLMSNVLRGGEISRTFLILLLLYFGTEADIADEGMRLSVQRMNEILKTCSFETLEDKNHEDDSFDGFVLKVLIADDRKCAIGKAIEEMEKIDLME